MKRIILLLLALCAYAVPAAAITCALEPMTMLILCTSGSGGGTTVQDPSSGAQVVESNGDQRGLTADPGITITENAATVAIGADDARQVRYRTAAGAVTGTASPGLDIGTDTTNERFYFPYAADTWGWIPRSGNFAVSDFASAAKQGNGTKVQLAGAGTPSTDDCAKFDANGNIVTAGAACGSGAGSGTGEYSGTIDFGSVPDGSCVDGTYTGTGATTGLIFAEGLPAALETGVTVRLWPSAADTIKGRACNFSGAGVDPVSATFKVKTVNGYLNASGAVNFDEISDGGYNTKTLTVTGAATGDHVSISIPAALETGIQIAQAIVTSANTISITAQNLSGGALDPISATYAVAVIR